MDVYDILEAVEHNPLARVLATVIHVEGHAYRKQGAVMVLMADGSKVGSISPGCLEADLAAYVPGVWDSQKPQMVEYDMRPADDFGWGETIGCGGLIRIILEPITGELLVHLLVAKASLDRGEAMELIREYGEGYSDIRYSLSTACAVGEELMGRAERSEACVQREGQRESEVPTAGEERVVTEVGPDGEGRGVLEAGTAGEERLVAWHGLEAKMSGKRRVLPVSGTVTRMEPKPRLIVFGANPDAAPLVQMAADSGFRVVVADWRDALCTLERFPGATEAVVAFPEALAARLALTPNDYVIIMSHQFEKDEMFVRHIAPFSLRYLGIMGSRERTERLMAGLERPEWLRYPVGLPIGSEGAYENAISMTAELITVKRGVRGSGTVGDAQGVRGRETEGCEVGDHRRETDGSKRGDRASIGRITPRAQGYGAWW
ncbi:XdhC family protein [Paenibacillus oryzisoli]|uniref:XdhC family protein n=1 Tax=Paenibacillus oryzisoli TaxID=1850517 RepID=UPI003D2679C5